MFTKCRNVVIEEGWHMLKESGLRGLKRHEDGGSRICADLMGCFVTVTAQNVRDEIDSFLVRWPQVAQVVPDQRLRHRFDRFHKGKHHGFAIKLGTGRPHPL